MTLLTLKGMLLTLTFTLKLTMEEAKYWGQTWWHHFSNSQLPFHQQPYSSSTSIWSLHFITHTLLYNMWTELRSFYNNRVAPMVQSSIRTFHGRHRELVDYYQLSISQMAMDIFPSRKILLSSITDTIFYENWLYE
jgi:hypothetical protein